MIRTNWHETFGSSLQIVPNRKDEEKSLESLSCLGCVSTKAKTTQWVKAVTDADDSYQSFVLRKEQPVSLTEKHPF